MRPSDLRAKAARTWPVLAVAVLLVVACSLLWVRPTVADAGSARATGDPATLAVTQPKSALFVGDSFTAGTSGLGRNAYPFLVCSAVGWGCSVDAEGETGYIDDGLKFHVGTQKAIDRLDGDKSRYDVDVLVADLGRNDIGVDSAADILAAATAFFTKARSFWPDATMVAIIPTFIDGAPYDNYAPLKAGLATISDTLNVKVVDPLADGWFNGVDTTTMVGEDGVHPNAYGNQFIAERLQDSLAALGLVDPRVVA